MARKHADIARQLRREMFLRHARSSEGDCYGSPVRRDIANGMATEFIRYALLDANPLQQVTDGR